MKNALRIFGLLLLPTLLSFTQNASATGSTGGTGGTPSVVCAVCRVHCGNMDFDRSYNVTGTACCSKTSICGNSGGEAICEDANGNVLLYCWVAPSTGP